MSAERSMEGSAKTNSRNTSKKEGESRHPCRIPTPTLNYDVLSITIAHSELLNIVSIISTIFGWIAMDFGIFQRAVLQINQ